MIAENVKIKHILFNICLLLIVVSLWYAIRSECLYQNFILVPFVTSFHYWPTLFTAVTDGCKY